MKKLIKIEIYFQCNNTYGLVDTIYEDWIDSIRTAGAFSEYLNHLIKQYKPSTYEVIATYRNFADDFIVKRKVHPSEIKKYLDRFNVLNKWFTFYYEVA